MALTKEEQSLYDSMLEKTDEAPVASPVKANEEEKQNSPKYSQGESLGLGALQGATFGFADEIESFVRSKLLENRPYEEIAKEVRTRYKTAKEDNPWTYGGGEFAGAVGTSIIPGIGAAKIAQGAGGVGKAIGLGAAQGGLYGVGSSENKGAQLAGDALTGAAIGGVAGGVFHGLGNAAEMISKKAKEVANNEALSLSNVGREATEKVIEGETALASRNRPAWELGEAASKVVAPTMKQSLINTRNELERVGAARASAYDEVTSILKNTRTNEDAATESYKVAQDIKDSLSPLVADLKLKALDEKSVDSIVNKLVGSGESSITDEAKPLLVRLFANTDFNDLSSIEKLRSTIKAHTTMAKQGFKFGHNPEENAATEQLFNKVHERLTKYIEDRASSIVPKLGEKIKSLNRDMAYNYDLVDGAVKGMSDEMRRSIQIGDWAALGMGGPTMLMSKVLAESMIGAPISRLAKYGYYKAAKSLIGENTPQPIPYEAKRRGMLSTMIPTSKIQNLNDYNNLKNNVPAEEAKTTPEIQTEQNKQSGPMNEQSSYHAAKQEDFQSKINETDPELAQLIEKANQEGNEGLKNKALFTALQRTASRRKLLA